MNIQIRCEVFQVHRIHSEEQHGDIGQPTIGIDEAGIPHVDATSEDEA